MPYVEFGEIEEGQSFKPLPRGKYLCQLVDIAEKTTRTGAEMWNMKFEVASGDYLGRFIFDNLVFSDAAKPRVKLICSRLGLDTTKGIDLTPNTILNKVALLTVEVEEYIDNTGQRRMRNSVPYEGYELAEQPPQQVEHGSERGAAYSGNGQDVPF